MKIKRRLCKSISILTAILLTAATIPQTALAEASYRPSPWAVLKMEICRTSGIVSEGFEAIPYTANITRRDFFELVLNTCRLYGAELPELPEAHPFSDTTDPVAEQAYMLGLTNGTAKGIFSPELPLTREMAAVVLTKIRLYFRENADSIYTTPEGVIGYVPPMDEQQANRLLNEYSSDPGEVSGWAKAYMADIYSLGILTGTGSNKLEPGGNITREQAAVLSLNMLAYCDETKLKEAGVTGSVIPAPTGIYISNAYGKNDLNLRWNAIPSASSYDVTIYINGEPTYTVRTDSTVLDLRTGSAANAPGTPPESLYESIFGNGNELIRAALQVTPVSSSGDPSIFAMKKEFTVTPWTSENEMITGNPDRDQFASRGEADRNMKEITVRVWNLSASGAKTPAARTLLVNRNVAADVEKIFEEIYNGKEKFPIKSVSCYSYRDGNSQHSNGTAIDINPTENYFLLRNGTIKAGSLWKPGSNPYSIMPQGDVVRAFNRYGWHWSPDMNWPNGKDYMHFSLLGI